MFLPKLVHELTECLVYCLGFLYSITSDQWAHGAVKGGGGRTFMDWENGRMTIWRFSYSANWETVGWRMGQVSPNICSESVSNTCYCFLHSQDSWVKGRNGNTENHALSLTSKTFDFSSHPWSYAVGPEVLLPNGEVLLNGGTTIALNRILRLPHGYFFMPLSQQTKKGVIFVAGMTDLDY